MNEVINMDVMCWDKVKVDKSFVCAAVSICFILIATFSEDIWAWSQENSGSFLVRSAYRLLLSDHVRSDHPSSSGGKMAACWKNLWRMPVPPNVRVLW
jgi:hypothetical protein